MNNNKTQNQIHLSIRILFPLIFSGAVTVCFVVLILFFSDYISDNIYENVKTNMERQLDTFAQSVERELYNMIDTVNETYYQSIKPNVYLSEAFSNEMEMLCNHDREHISQMCIYDMDGSLIWGSSTDAKDNVKNETWFQNSIDAVETISFGSLCLQLHDKDYMQMIPVSRCIELNGNGTTVQGILVIFFPMEDIDAILETYGSTSVEYCYLLDSESSLIYHPYIRKIQSGVADEWTIPELTLKESFVSISHDKEKWLMATHVIGYTGWTLVIINSLTDIELQNFNSYQIIWEFLCLIGIIMMFVDITLLKQITYPVLKLSKAMQTFGLGKLETRVEEGGIGELRSLEEGFNNMADKTQELMVQTIKHEQEKRYMERCLLQAQISPHFLYNTLDSIIWMIQGKQYEGAETMVSLLARFFRVALSKGDDIITLRQELEHATSYLAIQNIRFQDKFDFYVDVDDKLLDYMCPKITIQPILENAIYHGVENLYGDGEITLSIYLIGNDICIEIADNGEGMSEAQIQRILHHDIASSSDSKGSGVGVYNVDSRLKLLYGKKYGINIDSEVDEGTTVKIIIPKVSEVRVE